MNQITKPKNLNNPILDLTLTPQQYSSTKYETPYVLEFRSEGKKLIYFGSEHSKNPSDKQFEQIELLFQNFVKENQKDNATVVVIENFLPPLENSKTAMIEKYGESGLMHYLANQFNISSVCAEPDQASFIQFLLTRYRFERSDVARWIMLNILLNSYLKQANPITNGRLEKLAADFIFIETVTQLNRISQGETRKDVLEKIDEYYIRPLYEQFPTKITAKIESLVQKKIDVDFIKKIQDPFTGGTVYNDIASAANNVRDRFIAACILEELHNVGRVFAVFGVNHVVAQEPTFRAHFAKLKERSTQVQ